MEAKDFTIYKSENIYEERSYMAGKEAGIKEVVEWIEEYPSVYKPSPEAIQAKLKEWGIE